MYDENGYDPYDNYYTQAVEDAYFAMLDNLGIAATPFYTFVSPYGPMSYPDYLAYRKIKDTVEEQYHNGELPF